MKRSLREREIGGLHVVAWTLVFDPNLNAELVCRSPFVSDANNLPHAGAAQVDEFANTRQWCFAGKEPRRATTLRRHRLVFVGNAKVGANDGPIPVLGVPPAAHRPSLLRRQRLSDLRVVQTQLVARSFHFIPPGLLQSRGMCHADGFSPRANVTCTRGLIRARRERVAVGKLVLRMPRMFGADLCGINNNGSGEML